jgi:hypothetical protein
LESSFEYESNGIFFYIIYLIFSWLKLKIKICLEVRKPYNPWWREYLLKISKRGNYAKGAACNHAHVFIIFGSSSMRPRNKKEIDEDLRRRGVERTVVSIGRSTKSSDRAAGTT